VHFDQALGLQLLDAGVVLGWRAAFAQAGEVQLADVDEAVRLGVDHH
jgi:hypothetical protein